MKFVKQILVLCFILLSLLLKAGDGDSTRLRSLKGILSLDGKRSFVKKHPVGITGIRGGIQWKNTFRTGVGYYFLNREVRDAKIFYNPAGGIEDVRIQRIRFYYFAFFYEQLIKKNKRWEIYIPVMAGPGWVKNRTYSYNEYLFTEKERVALFELSCVAEYRFLRWFGVGAGLGYRKILWADALIEENLDAPIYSLKFKIYFDHLGKDLIWFWNRFYR
jgi:hypothetical protein